MKLRIAKKMLMGLALVVFFSHTATAVPIVNLSQPRVADSITGLVVGDFIYDVFFNNVANSTFVGDTAGATMARDAINAALNATTADLVRIFSTGVTVNNFGVQDSGGSTVRGVSFSIPNNWQPHASTVLAAPVAQFTLVGRIPEPLTLSLVVIGLAGLRATGKRAAPAS
tara:strand:+ start:6410 stop:6919 length:510 start_codon:yes stop_codon:yes gene_type:complete